MRRSSMKALAAGIIIVLLPGMAQATQLKLMTTKELAVSSERIVTGRVASVESFWNEKRTKVFTRTTVVVDGNYKGPGGGTVEILQLGGVVDNIRVTVDGAVAWAEGEEVLLFLAPYVEGAYSVTGMAQGKLAVERDPETGERYVSRPSIEGVEIVSLDEGGSPGPPVQDAGVSRVPLSKFIEDALGGSR